ncbi:hypothetical protein HS088_TW15G01041 [Tripterygium wilfordii]|uniref:RRM domain-containing protein n=1 Tax=Tripterygium wilfordii TaxID=458696 RepID=A0A7J7CN88_TRIWF|nr:binding partner of ACD11 1-like isoform X2 [Tripterygium wilfordii]KAF5735534.1 hypothetical protein HS088_TW15G01041 [Tripterygium wilfordii]
MYPGGYTVEVTNLSPRATEEDVWNFFAHCGAVEHVEIIRSGESSCTAYVTFRDAYALEIAILLSGAAIVDQRVCITHWGAAIGEYDPWNGHVANFEGNNSSTVTHVNQLVSSPGEAVTITQEVVKTMIAKGYVLGKDALIMAKAFDESHHVSAIAAAKVAELSKKIGLTDKINSSVETLKSVDEKYHVSEISKSVASVTGTAAIVTGRTAAAAANAFVNSRFFAAGALWASDVLSRAAKAAADMGTRPNE